jgi:hypothetical protein
MSDKKEAPMNQTFIITGQDSRLTFMEDEDGNNYVHMKREYGYPKRQMVFQEELKTPGYVTEVKKEVTIPLLHAAEVLAKYMHDATQCSGSYFDLPNEQKQQYIQRAIEELKK